MRILSTVLFLTIAPVIAWADGPAYQCQIHGTVTSASASAAFDNRSQACYVFELHYTSTGFTALSIEVDSAPDNAGSPGTWTAISSTFVTDGTNPNTTLASGLIGIHSSAAWVRVNLTSVTGSGSVTYQLFGAAGASVKGSSGSSVQTPVFNSIDAGKAGSIANALATSTCVNGPCLVTTQIGLGTNEVRPWGTDNNFNYPSNGIGSPSTSVQVAGMWDLATSYPQWSQINCIMFDTRHCYGPTIGTTFTQAGQGTYAHFGQPLYLFNKGLTGGRNMDQVNGDKTTISLIEGQLYKNTMSQSTMLNFQEYGRGNGDMAIFTADCFSSGGANAQGDESECEAYRVEVGEYGAVFSSVLSSITTNSTTGEAQFNMSSTTNNGEQGEGRQLVDITNRTYCDWVTNSCNWSSIASSSNPITSASETQATCSGCNLASINGGSSSGTLLTTTVQNGTGGTASASLTLGVITSCTATGGSNYQTAIPPTLVVNGTWSVRPIITASVTSGSLSGCTIVNGGTNVVLTGDITVQPMNTFPQTNVTVGVTSSAIFTVGKVACSFGWDWECQLVTAKPSSTQITFAKLEIPHRAGEVIYTGGLTGYAWGMDADTHGPSDTAMFSMPDSTVVSNIRSVRPIIYNNGNTIGLFVGTGPSGGNLGSFDTRAFSSMGSGGSATATVSSNTVTGCNVSGGTGYLNYRVPQLVPVGTWTTPPAMHVSTTSSGALQNCVVDNPGTGVAAGLTVNVNPVNSGSIYPSAKIFNVYNFFLGYVDGTINTDNPTPGFNNGDTLEADHYFQQHVTMSNEWMGQYQPPFNNNPSSGARKSFFGYHSAGASAFQSQNYNDVTLYYGYISGRPDIIGLGQLHTPYFAKIIGAHNSGLDFDRPVFGSSAGAIRVHCSVTSAVLGTTGSNCTTFTNPVPIEISDTGIVNGTSQDVIQRTPADGSIDITVGAPGSSGSGNVPLRWTCHPTTGCYWKTYDGTQRQMELDIHGNLVLTNGQTIAPSTLVQFGASGTMTLGTSAIAAGNCATVNTSSPSPSGTSSTSTITITPNVDPTGVTGYGPGQLTFFTWPTANQVNLKVCNPTGATITPSALTVNYRVQF